MMGVGEKERTKEEFAQLLGGARLELVQTLAIDGSAWVVLEGKEECDHSIRLSRVLTHTLRLTPTVDACTTWHRMTLRDVLKVLSAERSQHNHLIVRSTRIMSLNCRSR